MPTASVVPHVLFFLFLQQVTVPIEGSSVLHVATGGIYLALASLHLLLFCFYPRLRANLLFSAFAFSVTLLMVVNFLISSGLYGTDWDSILDAASLSAITAIDIFLLLFLHVAFSSRLPWSFRVFVPVRIISLVLYLLVPTSPISVWLTAALWCYVAVESVRIMVNAVRKQFEGSWIVGLGVLLFVTAPLGAALQILQIPLPRVFVFFRSFYLFGMIISASIYLARRFALTNRELEGQLAQVKQLSAKELEQSRAAAKLAIEREQEKARFAAMKAENERRAGELEEARQLQLSMLPKILPQLPNIEIAAYMKPATEVGGDYYDFHLEEDGTLTLAVGDATGHGLKAGTMVTATKSLFNELARDGKIENIFRRSSAALKNMNLRGMFMAMTVAKIKDNRMVVSCAGMPPVFVYRASDGSVEEVSVKAMPLGSSLTCRYEEREMTLSAGDAVLFMSDGFPETFNEQDEMLDYPQASLTLAEVARESPRAIIDHFVRTGNKWAGNRPQHDDVTFVVVKVKESNGDHS